MHLSSTIMAFLAFFAVGVSKTSQQVPYSVEERNRNKQAYYEKIKAKPWGDVSKKYIASLGQEEKELLQEFYTTTGTDADFLKGSIQHSNDPFQKHMQTQNGQALVDGKIAPIMQGKEWVQKLLKKCCIAPSSITIWGIRRYFPSSGTQDIYLPDGHEVAKITVLHEIMHLLHNDTLVPEIMLHISKDLSNPVHARWSRFIEKRADIFASLYSVNRADDNAKDFSVSHRSEDTAGNASQGQDEVYKVLHAHPATEERGAYLQKVAGEMRKAVRLFEENRLWDLRTKLG